MLTLGYVSTDTKFSTAVLRTAVLVLLVVDKNKQHENPLFELCVEKFVGTEFLNTTAGYTVVLEG